jgi:hypothetical protein
MTPAKQLAEFMARYDPEVRDVARAAHARLRRRLPGAVEMVYDNYNALVIGFGPSERASEAVFSIALYPRYVVLFFLQGVGLPDPNRLLRGSGKQVRSIILEAASTLDESPVQDLIAAALAKAKMPMPNVGRNRLIIKSISAKQRPRRPS